jgi:hypothetical protein
MAGADCGMRETSNGHLEALSLASVGEQEKDDFLRRVVQLRSLHPFILIFYKSTNRSINVRTRHPPPRL